MHGTPHLYIDFLSDWCMNANGDYVGSFSTVMAEIELD